MTRLAKKGESKTGAHPTRPGAAIMEKGGAFPTLKKGPFIGPFVPCE